MSIIVISNDQIPFSRPFNLVTMVFSVSLWLELHESEPLAAHAGFTQLASRDISWNKVCTQTHVYLNKFKCQPKKFVFQSDESDIFIVEDDDRRNKGIDGSGAASVTHSGIALFIALILAVGT